MAKFLSTRATSAQIEQIINDGKKYVVLVSPFLKLSASVVQIIIESAERGTRTIVVYGKDDLQPELQSKLKKIPNLELYFVKNLHAKCYFNEELLVLSSMNLYEFSEINNWEMSVFISKLDDKELYLSALNDVKRNLRIIGADVSFEPNDTKTADDANSLKTPISVPVLFDDLQKKLRQTVKKLAPEGGVCIRCGEKIPADYDKPYCKSCYHSWLRFENYEYKEKRCHLCGNDAKTTIEYPLCFPCFNKIAAKLGKV